MQLKTKIIIVVLAILLAAIGGNFDKVKAGYDYLFPVAEKVSRCLYDGMEGKTFVYGIAPAYKAKWLKVNCEGNSVIEFPSGKLHSWKSTNGMVGYALLDDEQKETEQAKLEKQQAKLLADANLLRKETDESIKKLTSAEADNKAVRDTLELDKDKPENKQKELERQIAELRNLLTKKK